MKPLFPCWPLLDGKLFPVRSVNVMFLYVILVKVIEFESFPTVYTYKHLFLVVVPSTCQMLSKINAFDVTSYLSKSEPKSEHIGLQSIKGNDTVIIDEILKNNYANITLYFDIHGSSKLSDGFLDMFA